MAIPLIKLLTLVMLAAGAWAILATLFTPPSPRGGARGWKQRPGAGQERSSCWGASVAGLVVVWLLVVRLLRDHSAG
jgi:hypothetical protein